MRACEWMHDEICVNADCPMCADYCPVADIEGVCRYEERIDKKSDLISKSALLAKMIRTDRYFAVKFDIEEMPTIDAVPVVRCKDCKHVKHTCDGRLVCGATLNPNWVCGEHFCACGERRDNK